MHAINTDWTLLLVFGMEKFSSSGRGWSHGRTKECGGSSNRCTLRESKGGKSHWALYALNWLSQGPCIHHVITSPVAIDVHILLSPPPHQWILSQPALPFFLVYMHLNQQIPPLIFQRRARRLAHRRSLERVSSRTRPEERLNLMHLVEMMMILPYHLLWMQKNTACMRVIRTSGTFHVVLKVKEVTFDIHTTMPM